MKYVNIFALLIFSIVVMLNNGFYAHALNDSDYMAYDGDSSIENHDGYCFVYSNFAVSFDSFDSYKKNAEKARKNIGNGDVYPMGYYLENYDYIYVPKFLEHNAKDIICIFITPRYCKVTYKISGKELNTFHYFKFDYKTECDECESAFSNNNTVIVNGITYYKKSSYNINDTYCCQFNNSYFEFDSEFGISNMEQTPFVKLYTDKHLNEKNGNLYYINDNGKNETGWKTVNGHKYYFQKDSCCAVKGKVMTINRYLYKFNNNGICKGKYTGYVKQKDGTKVYCKNGIIVS